MREIDDREIPAGWPYGLFAIGAQRPNTLPTDPNSFGSAESADDLGMAYPLNQDLARWAFNLTRNVVIPDTPALRQQRDAWKGFPNAQRPPFVLMGETLGSVRYWHGPGRSQWVREPRSTAGSMKGTGRGWAVKTRGARRRRRPWTRSASRYC